MYFFNKVWLIASFLSLFIPNCMGRIQIIIHVACFTPISQMSDIFQYLCYMVKHSQRHNFFTYRRLIPCTSSIDRVTSTKLFTKDKCNFTRARFARLTTCMCNTPHQLSSDISSYKHADKPNIIDQVQHNYIIFC